VKKDCSKKLWLGRWAPNAPPPPTAPTAPGRAEGPCRGDTPGEPYRPVGAAEDRPPVATSRPRSKVLAPVELALRGPMGPGPMGLHQWEEGGGQGWRSCWDYNCRPQTAHPRMKGLSEAIKTRVRGGGAHPILNTTVATQVPHNTRYLETGAPGALLPMTPTSLGPRLEANEDKDGGEKGRGRGMGRERGSRYPVCEWVTQQSSMGHPSPLAPHPPPVVSRGWSTCERCNPPSPHSKAHHSQASTNEALCVPWARGPLESGRAVGGGGGRRPGPAEQGGEGAGGGQAEGA
jgi:hypothetical protein